MTIGRGLLAAAVTTVAAAAIGAGVQASATVGPKTITVTTPFDGGSTRHVDLGRKSPRGGPGDLFLATGVPLSDEQTGRRVGTLEGVETVLSAAHGGTVSFSGTLRLQGGTLQVEGVIRHSDRHPALAVVGGTGDYAGASGEMTDAEDEKRKLSIETITLL
jgi:hypothetical protein